MYFRNSLKVFVITVMGAWFLSCTNESVVEESGIQRADLLNHWEAKDIGTGFMLDFTYCNSFELRNNSDFAVYYWESGKPLPERIDGNWRFVEPDSLYFDFGTWHKVGIKITSFDEGQMTTLESNGDTYVLYNN